MIAALDARTETEQAHTILDPALRTGIDQALLYARRGSAVLPRPLVEALLVAGAASIEHREPSLVAGAMEPALDIAKPSGPYIWRVPQHDCPTTSALSELFATLVPDLIVGSVEPAEQQTLRRGHALLQQVLPSLAPSALAHTRLIVVANTRAADRPGAGERFFRSATLAALPGAMFLSRGVLENPFSAASALLHEALHLKFIDMEYTQQMGAVSEVKPLSPPWQRIERAEELWPVKRAMTALHVFVGLALFYEKIARMGDRAEQLAGMARPAGWDTLLRSALDRAHYLSSELSLRSSALAPPARAFLSWLVRLTEAIEAPPPLDEVNVRLQLELYTRETGILCAALRSPRPGRALNQHEELVCALAPSLTARLRDDACQLLGAAAESLPHFASLHVPSPAQDFAATVEEFRRALVTRVSALASSQIASTLLRASKQELSELLSALSQPLAAAGV